MDVIMLFDQNLLAKQQNDIHMITLRNTWQNVKLSRMVRCSYK